MADHPKRKVGFTLVECVAVVAIVSTIALMAFVKLGGVFERSKQTAAASDLSCLRQAFLDDESGYLRDLRGIPGFSVGYLRVANLLIATNLYGAVEVADRQTEGVRVDAEPRVDGCAPSVCFTRWDEAAGRGWRGPYVNHPSGTFPARGERRFPDDLSAAERGFFPDLSGLREPDDFLDRRADCSIYGFPGEPAVIDPWGNPYVLQIPPPQAFPGVNTNVTDATRFRYARLVSAGPDGRLDTPCFGENRTNRWMTSWTSRVRRLSRQAGRIDGEDVSARGDDLVLFLTREDIDEGEDE